MLRFWCSICILKWLLSAVHGMADKIVELSRAPTPAGHWPGWVRGSETCWRRLHAGAPPFMLADYRVFVTAGLAGGTAHGPFVHRKICRCLRHVLLAHFPHLAVVTDRDAVRVDLNASRCVSVQLYSCPYLSLAFHGFIHRVPGARPVREAWGSTMSSTASIDWPLLLDDGDATGSDAVAGRDLRQYDQPAHDRNDFHLGRRCPHPGAVSVDARVRGIASGTFIAATSATSSGRRGHADTTAAAGSEGA